MTLQSIGSVIRAHAQRKAPDSPAITYGDETVTWRQLEQRTNQRARQLQANGVIQDDLVAITLPNGVGFHEAAIAAWKAGATPCMLSSRLPGREASDILDVAKPRVLLGDVASDTAIPKLVGDDDLSAFDDSPTPDMAPAYWKAVTSGGSTGRPKVIIDHMPGRVDPDLMPMTAMGMEKDGAMLNPGPLYHNGPFLFSSYALIHGMHVVGMKRFDAEETLRLIEKHRIGWICMVPTMMHRIWALPKEIRERYDVSSIKAVWHMAAPCPPWLKHFWIEWLGAEKIWETYAGTEASGTFISGPEWLAKPGSVGYASPDKFRIVREDGTQCDVGEVGEIQFPQASRQNFHYVGVEPKPGEDTRPLSIGDLGYVDADNYLFLADRRTDLILRGGANIYPAEVEAALDEHPSISSSAVIGLPSDDLGQEVHAIVQIAPDHTFDQADIEAFLDTRLNRYKRPNSYELIQQPLRDDAGKVRRSMLRQERLTWVETNQPFKYKAAAEPA